MMLVGVALSSCSSYNTREGEGERLSKVVYIKQRVSSFQYTHNSSGIIINSIRGRSIRRIGGTSVWIHGMILLVGDGLYQIKIINIVYTSWLDTGHPSPYLHNQLRVLHCQRPNH